MYIFGHEDHGSGVNHSPLHWHGMSSFLTRAENIMLLVVYNC